MSVDSLELGFRRADPKRMDAQLLAAWCAWRHGWKPNVLRRAIREVLWR